MVFKINKARLGLGLALLVGLALRLAFVRATLDSTDEVNFALSLDRYDLALHQPHFPGYPLYVLVAKACAWVAPVEWALVLPGLLLSPLLCVAVYRAVRGRSGEGAALTAAWLLMLAPGLIDVASTAGSDGLGLAVLGIALALAFIATEAGARDGLSIVAGAVAGLGLGVRPSLAPLALSLPLVVLLLAGRGAAGRALLGLAMGTIAWVLPFAAWVGPSALVAAAVSHVAGHFSTWGGAFGSASASLGLGARALALAATATQGLVPALAIAAVVVLFARPRWSRAAAALLLVAAPYALWVWLAQNVERARHAAPLVAWACVLVGLGAGIAAARRHALAWSGAVAVLALIPGLVAAASARPLPWRREAATFIAGHLGTERVVVLGTHLPRVSRYYAPSLRIGQARSGRDVAAALAETPPGVSVVTSSEIPLDDAALELTPLARFADRTLYRVALPRWAAR